MAIRGSSNSEHNYFTPDTPDADAWQQYRCRACNLPKRVAIPPDRAPMTKRLPCARCESRQNHRADGGSGVISVLDLTGNPNISPAEVMGALRSARAVRSPVLEDREDPASDYVMLTPGDEQCSDCEGPILIEQFPPEAPFIRIIANQKRRRGSTYCEPCLSQRNADE